MRALVRELAAGGARQVVLTSIRRGAQAPVPAGPVEVATVPARHRGDLPVARTARLVSRLARDHDILHLHLGRRGSLGAFAAVVTTVNRPVVVHLHGSAAVPLRTGEASSIRSRVLDATLEGLVLSAASVVVVPSPRLGEVARAAAAREVAVVPPASLPVATAAAERPLDGLAPGRRVVSVGPLTLRRQPEALVRALSLQPPDTQLLLLGDGPRRAAVDREVRDRGLDGRVHVVPRVTWQVVTDHLAHADVVATASLSGEDPTATLLAMALGRPVVSTGVEAIPALVSDGIDGLLVPAGDDEALAGALRRVLTDADLAATLGASARRRSTATGWATAAGRVAALLSPATG